MMRCEDGWPGLGAKMDENQRNGTEGVDIHPSIFAPTADVEMDES